MLVLGIDPGTRITGYGCVEISSPAAQPRLVEAGVLRFRPQDLLERRLVQLHEELLEIIQQLKPDRVAVEKLYSHYRHAPTAIQMAHARGVILLAAAQSGLKLIHLPATAVKKATTGNGHASKVQMQRAVAAQLGLEKPPEPPDVADALAIALCAARRM